MKYTKEELKKGKYYIKVLGDDDLKEYIRDIIGDHYPTSSDSCYSTSVWFGTGPYAGYMSDDGTYFRKEKYIELTPQDIGFGIEYQIY